MAGSSVTKGFALRRVFAYLKRNVYEGSTLDRVSLSDLVRVFFASRFSLIHGFLLDPVVVTSVSLTPSSKNAKV